MNFINLYLLSTYLKKWSFNDHRITINYSFSFDTGYERNHVEMRIGSPVNMVNEFLNSVFYRAKECISARDSESDQDGNSTSNNIILMNESEVKRKLSVFVSKILKEFNQNKRSRGRSRMISTRSLDFYYNDFEFEPLDENVKFYVHLNRGANKMSGDLWSNAAADLKLALELNPQHIIANKLMARALNKLGRYKESISHLKIYAEAENSAESLDFLAGAYVHLNDYDAAEKIYKQIEKNFEGSNLSQYGRAQLAYKQGKGYKTLLDRIFKSEPEWLRDKLKNDWEYKLPGYVHDDQTMWNAATAARYLGFERPFDLTRRAFNEELPSYFDSEKGTIRFVKNELDHWVELMNRYNLDNEKYQVFIERLTPEELKKADRRKIQKPVKTKTKKNKTEKVS